MGAYQRDIGYLIKSVPALVPVAGVEGAEQTGPWIERTIPHLHLSAVFQILGATSSLAAGQSFDISAIVEDAVDDSGSGAATFATATTLTVTNSGGSAGPFDGVLQFDIDLSGAKRYVRLKPTITPSNGTDVCNMAAIAALDGSDHHPQ